MGFTRTNSGHIFLNLETSPGCAYLETKRCVELCSILYLHNQSLFFFFCQTGRSKHYGFIEFDSSTVAQIVAETMDNYLLMGHILRCKVIPKDQVHPELWVGANRKWRVVPADRVARVEHNKANKHFRYMFLYSTCFQPRTESEQARAAKRLLKRQQARKRKLEAAGIEYDFDAVSYVSISVIPTVSALTL